MDDTTQGTEQDKATETATSETQSGTTPPVEETTPASEPTPPAEEPAAPPPPPAPPVEDVAVLAPPKAVEAAPVASATQVADGDAELVVTLKTQLAAFVRAVAKPGRVPEDYKEAARLSLRMTKFIVQFPKVPVLDAYLAFIKENIDGAADAKNYLKGTTTLQAADERQVAFLYNLFYTLASGNPMNIKQSDVLSVLKKPEIMGYYNRKVAVMNKA